MSLFKSWDNYYLLEDDKKNITKIPGPFTDAKNDDFNTDIEDYYNQEQYYDMEETDDWYKITQSAQNSIDRTLNDHEKRISELERLVKYNYERMNNFNSPSMNNEHEDN